MASPLHVHTPVRPGVAGVGWAAPHGPGASPGDEMKKRSRWITAGFLAVLVVGPSACGDDPANVDGPKPTVVGVSPAWGTVGTEVRISGNDFRPGATVLFGGDPATLVDVAGDTEIFAFVPEGLVEGETVDVQVRNEDGTRGEIPAAFTGVAPDLDFVNAATKPSGNAGSTVILEGDAFGDLQGSGAVNFSDGTGGTVAAPIAAPDDWTNRFIVTTVPSGAQSGPVFVTTATGESEALEFTVTQNAAFSPSTIFWTETTAMPEPLSGHSAIYVPIEDTTGITVQRAYVVGGTRLDETLSGQVHHAVIQAAGGLDPWVSATSLPVPRAFSASVAATPYNSKVPGSGKLFVFGGIDENGDPSYNVFSMELDSEGNLSEPVEETPLPVPLHSAGAVVFRSHVYLAGGATTGNATVASVYRAAIDTLGFLEEWVALEPLPAPRAYHGFQTFGGYFYAIGGDGGPVSPQGGLDTGDQARLDDVLYARINLRNGDLLGGWTENPARLGKTRSKHAALVAGGNMFVSSGLYSAAKTGSSENTYAQVNADGSVSSFGGATGSNTLLSAGAGNLFNQASFVYVDGAGVAHVMILGGDNVNEPGQRTGKVFYY